MRLSALAIPAFLIETRLSKKNLRNLKREVITEIWDRPDKKHFISGCRSN